MDFVVGWGRVHKWALAESQQLPPPALVPLHDLMALTNPSSVGERGKPNRS